MVAECSQCGLTTSVPEGTYTLVSMTQQAIANWHEQQRLAILAEIAAARDAEHPREAVT